MKFFRFFLIVLAVSLTLGFVSELYAANPTPQVKKTLMSFGSFFNLITCPNGYEAVGAGQCCKDQNSVPKYPNHQKVNKQISKGSDKNKVTVEGNNAATQTDKYCSAKKCKEDSVCV